jgi:hypothetical protein
MKGRTTPQSRRIGCSEGVILSGYIDQLSGEFVPAIELDVPMQLAALLANTDVIIPGSFTMVEKELEAGTVTVIPTPALKFLARRHLERL